MSNTKKLATAALLGLLSTSFVTATVAQAAEGDKAEKSATAEKKMEKHACKGLNSCKGNGGGDAEHFGKNECKGKGSCATDGSKK